MSRINSLIFGLICLFAIGLNAQVSTKWSNGLKVEDAEKGHSIKFGGIIMYDAIFYSTNASMDSLFSDHAENGAEFRRTRLYSSGNIFKNIKFKMQLDFAGGDTDFKDVYIEFAKVPVLGNVRVGQMKEPFRLEALTSSKYLSFMERALPINLQMERNSGIMFHNKIPKSNASWALGFFRNANGYGDDKAADGGYAITGRLAAQVLPKNEKKNQILHVGGAFSYRHPKSDSYKVSARPESHLAEKYFNSGTINNVENIFNLGLELALVMNKLSVQGEYLRSSVSTVDGNTDQTLSGFYAYASYFISGATRPYKGGGSGFNRVKPKSNVGMGGKGAWEVALRFSSLSSNNDNVSTLNGITAGVNWYLNSGTRIMTNYVLSTLKDIPEQDDATSSAIQFRFQLDF
jgi:phosphate-selective porin OprO/OprP